MGPELLMKQFDLSLKVAEQLITLATGLLGVTLVVAKDLSGGRVTRILKVAWTCLVASIAVGVLTIGALTGSLEKDPPSVWGPPAWFGSCQLVLFLGGTVCALVYKWRAGSTVNSMNEGSDDSSP